MITENKNCAGSLSPSKVETHARKNMLSGKTEKSNGSIGELEGQHPETQSKNTLYYLDEHAQQIVILQPEKTKAILDQLGLFIYSCLRDAGRLIEAPPQTLKGGELLVN